MLGYSRYEDGPYCNERPACRGCSDTEEKLESMKHYFEGVVKMLYGKMQYNEADLDHCLQELCADFDISWPMKELQVVSKKQEKIFAPDFRTKFMEVYL